MRFPGKALYPIAGVPLLQRVFERASNWSSWDELVIATPDQEIADFSTAIGADVVMTRADHVRGLDRVAEAARLMGYVSGDSDIVVNVQGDEPLLSVDMFDALCRPIEVDSDVHATFLGMPIQNSEDWLNPDTVKVIANEDGEVLYTSRAPIPYSSTGFSPELGATKIFGLFAFRSPALQEFCVHPETRLEELESCDSNRLLSMHFRQKVVLIPHRDTFSVDRLSDVELVEEALRRESPHERSHSSRKD